ncbi:hypothetical protein [Arenimonas alkanexedens]
MSYARTSSRLAAAILPLALMACGAAPQEAAADSAPAASSLRSMVAEGASSDECPLLSEAGLRRHFPKAPAELESRFRNKTYPSCTYVWATEAKRKMEFGGQTVEVGGEGRVTLTVAKVSSPDSDWQRVLSSYRIEPPVAVDGIGDRAVWSDQRGQLSVLDANWVLHVAVADTDAPDQVRDKAIAMAREILPGLK